MKRSLVLPLAAAALLVACGGSAASTPAPPAFRVYLDSGNAVERLDGSGKPVKLPPGALSPDGKRLFATYGRDLRGFDAGTGAMNGELGLDEIYSQVAGFSPSGSFLALAGGAAPMDWFAVVANTLSGPVKTAMLKGSFTFDALSDDGRSLFLVEHVGGPDDYRVRRFDLLQGRLDPTILVEKGALPTALMNGQRYASVAVPSFQTVYSLYYGRDGAFVHALSLNGGPILCIDLPGARALDPQRQAQWTLALSPAHDALYAVNGAEGFVSRVDLINHQVRSGSFSPPPAPAGGWSWTVNASAKEWEMGGSATISADGKTLFASALHGYVAIDTTTLKLKGAYLTSSRVSGLALSPDGRWLLAVRDEDRLVKLSPADGHVEGVLYTANWPLTLLRVLPVA